MSRPHFRIPLAKPAYLGAELEYLEAAVKAQDLTQGHWVEAFEDACADYLGVEYAVAVSSGTAGLHLAAIVAGWDGTNNYSDRPDQILTTPLTYVASANAIRYVGATPRFHDVDPDSWTLDPIGPLYYDGALLVDLYGIPCKVPEPLASGGEVVYDACEAFGATISGRPLTARGGMHVFSFYANKVITTGEGGLVTTNDSDQADELRHLRGQGQSRDRRYWHDRVGYNYRMTDVAGALGLAQIEQIDTHLERRARRVDQYCEAFHGRDIYWPVPQQLGVVAAPWLFACTIPAHISRDGVMATLAEHGVESRPVFPCLHQMPAHEYGGQRFPHAEAWSEQGIVLPLFAEMTEGQCAEVCDLVLVAVSE